MRLIKQCVQTVEYERNPPLNELLMHNHTKLSFNSSISRRRPLKRRIDNVEELKMNVTRQLVGISKTEYKKCSTWSNTF